MKTEKFIGKKVIVRGVQSGVFYGVLESLDGQIAELSNCRNIWYWSGANNLNQMALDGVKNPGECKISQAVESIVLTDICEVIPCSKKSIKCLDGVEIWKY